MGDSNGNVNGVSNDGSRNGNYNGNINNGNYNGNLNGNVNSGSENGNCNGNNNGVGGFNCPGAAWRRSSRALCGPCMLCICCSRQLHPGPCMFQHVCRGMANSSTSFPA